MSGWLVDNFRVLGLHGQNWMLVFAGALVAYLSALALMRHRRRTP